MKRRNQIWILGFLLNFFFLYAVFQIYFQSPVIHITNSYAAPLSPKIHRIVFFVCDGLRADTFYRNPKNHPYLTKLLNANNSVWGISDTRVPTESRPGHIALFAGIYEDPSAIFTGWKKNLVEFDSVFNQTKYSIALGSPDIVDMFGDGVGREKIYYESYPASWQDFLRSDSYKLDTWVLDQLKNLVAKHSLPMHDKLLIFLHMLGVDNTGHAHKPNSDEYLANVRVVDHIVPEVEELVKKFYNDDKTLYIFTSDHGMTDWGSHGAGSTDETETPFIIWGPGIKNVNAQVRLKQADFCALIAGVLGIHFPTNSIGRFPSSIWSDSQFAYAATLGNFMQIHELMIWKKAAVNIGKFPFVPFSRETEIDSILQSAESFNQIQQYEAGIQKLEIGIDVVSDGIVYYERYDQLLLTSFTTYSFLAWMTLIAITFFSHSNVHIELFSKANLFEVSASIAITLILFEWSVFRIPYTLAPIYLTRITITAWKSQNNPLQELLNQLKTIDWIFAVMGLVALVNTFYNRKLISISLMINCFWTFKSKTEKRSDCILLLLSSLVLASFPLVPIMELHPNNFIVSLGSLLNTTISLYWLHQYSRDLTMAGPEPRDKTLIYFQTILISLAGVLVHFPDFIVTRIGAWLSIPFMFLIPILLSSPILSIQFLSIFLGISTPFTYLSLNYEVFFIPCLFLTLFICLKLEVAGESSIWKEFWFQRIDGAALTQVYKDLSYLNSIRLSSLQLCFVYLSFFGIGNIASISSFDPTASRCFVSVFTPFVMTGLLLIKIIGPFLLVACAFRLFIVQRIEIHRNFLVLLCLCTGMAIYMFLNVTNVGSWLQIGTSISHYVIVQVTTLFLFCLFRFANALTGIERIPLLTRSKLL